ncbi:hypothetical protein DPMN_021379 [Dreissena polymorpha]|uniref:Uncharacterized protein n=1 Tax=Dreissena polymorpha TaxID=45954 RepID=A0A9D4S942_DREPO|nr:hypothetical protein DPMN_021379 [Dreissena polymorpha]
MYLLALSMYTFHVDYWVYYDPVSAAPLSYDEQALYSLFIVCNDGVSDSDAKEIQVSITPNSPPVPAIDGNIHQRELSNTSLDFYIILYS